MHSVARLINSFDPEHYQLSLDIDRPNRTFHGTVTINGTSKTEDKIRLHAKDLTIETTIIDGHKATFESSENDELVLHHEKLSSGKHVVVLGFSGTITDQMHGMYPCYFKHQGQAKELIATQFESHHAREVFPCVDEPEAKATFDVTLTTETGITVLGNMPVVSQKEENGRLVTSFERTPRMSSYLLAWVVGEMQKKSATTKRGVEVNVWATPNHSPASLDFALDFATRTIDYFEEYFGIEYPLPKSDHVALPDFSSGAMENWGLITYRELALLADPATATVDSRHYVAMVVGHELSHQWFGNLVTMKWWDNLWLNESFANFIENLPIDAMHPDWNIWLDYASTWSLMAMRRDAINGVQPVQVDVHHPDEISSLFDGAIVYGKGGRLIGMLREYLGEEAFRAGLKQYFKAFQYQNTSGDDLWDCLEKVSGKPVRDFMNKWVLRPGYPVLHVRHDGLNQEQFFIGDHAASDALWPLPLSPAKPSADLPATFETKEVTATIDIDQRFNVGNWSHYVTHYSDEHFGHLLENIQHYSPLDRLQLLNERVLLTRSGHVANSSLIPLLTHSREEANESVWGILSLALGELKKFVETSDKGRDDLKRLAGYVSETQFARLGWEQLDNESENDIKLRPIVIGLQLFSEAAPVLEETKRLFTETASIEMLDPELRGAILAGLVKSGIDQPQFDTLLKAYQTAPSSEIREEIAGALTDTKNPDQIQQLLGCITNSDVVRLQDVSHWYVYLVRSRYAKGATWQWLRDNWTWIKKSFDGDKSYDDFARYSASALSTRAQLEEYIDFFSPMKSEPALTRVIELGIAEIQARVELIESQQAAVLSALADFK